MKLSAVIPVHNGGQVLKRCLKALAASTRPPDELIVVDDGCTDGSADIARQHGAQVIALDDGPRGAAFARNRGVERASGDLVVFVDADVAVHPDTLARIEGTMTENPGIDALFGSYDDDPPTPGLTARYKNLLHHYVHQHGRREASTFWSGCGAIRRDVFVALGGFDEGQRMLEDIELGARLRRGGYRILLCPEIQVAHLKQWTLAGLVRSDILDRAVPWTRLILRESHLPSDLNLDMGNRLGAMVAWSLVLFLVLGFFWPPLWAGALLALPALVALNADLYRFFARRGGLGFAAGAAGLHALYLLYSSLVFGVMFIGHSLSQNRPRRILLLLLLVTLLKGWLWSVVVPIWQAYDEDPHFGYAQEVARQRTWPVVPPSLVPEEQVILWYMVYPPRLAHWREPLDLSPDARAEIADLKQQLDTPAARTNLVAPTWFTRFVDQHPPLYYTLQAFVHELGAGRNILVRVAWMRLLSVAMGAGTVVCAYGAARALWPDRPWWPAAAAALVSFHPLFTFLTSVINNTALEILCFTALVWLAIVIARQGMNWKRGLMLGGVLAAGLLTKSSFLVTVPLVVLLWAWDLWRARRRCRWGGWALAAGLPVLLAGWWYAGFLASGGAEMADVFFSPGRPCQPLSLFDYLLRYPWITRYRSFMQHWWGLFGWGDAPYPASLYAALEVFTWLAFLGWLWLALRGFMTRHVHRDDASALILGVMPTLALIIFYTALGYRTARYGAPFRAQARYFLTPVAAQVMALMSGWAIVRRGQRWLLIGLCVAMMGLNTYALFGVVVPRYYGGQAIVRHEPIEETALLAGAEMAREFVLDEGQLSRVDVWLRPGPETESAQATVALYADGRGIVHRQAVKPAQMTFPSPTMIRFQAPPASDQSYRVELSADQAKAGLAADGGPALKAYRRVPALQIPERMAVLQPAWYTPGRLVAMSAAYVLTLLGVGLGLSLSLARFGAADTQPSPSRSGELS